MFTRISQFFRQDLMKKMTLTVELQLTKILVGRANFSVRYCRRQIGQCEQHIKQQVGVYMLLFKDA